MHYKIASVLVTLTFVILFMTPASSIGQGGGKKKGGGGGFNPGGGGFGPGGGGFGGKGGGMGNDPNKAFDYLANGRNFFNVTENAALRLPLNDFLVARGITTGMVTRELYIAFDQERMANRGGGFGNQGGGRGGAGGGGFQNPAEQMNQLAEMEFKRYDRNEDGQLNFDEMPNQLKEELTRWDTNRDNLINLDEYKLFFYSKYTSRQGGRNGPGVGPVDKIIDEEELDAKPYVARTGKLNFKDLPEWWKRLDVDPKDAQVSLAEWRAGGMGLDEFKEWDRNDDGLITPDEAINRQKIIMIASAKERSDDDEDGGGGGGFFGGGKKKGPGGKKGNFGADNGNGADDGSGMQNFGKGKKGNKGGPGGGPGGGGKGGKKGGGGGGAALDNNNGGGFGNILRQIKLPD